MPYSESLAEWCMRNLNDELTFSFIQWPYRTLKHTSAQATPT